MKTSYLKNAWCSKKKEKDFHPGEVCPLVFLKRNVSRVNKV
jgi:hypothetical protein